MQIAPLDGEYLYDEENDKWIPLIKKKTGHPDIEASLQNVN